MTFTRRLAVLTIFCSIAFSRESEAQRAQPLGIGWKSSSGPLMQEAGTRAQSRTFSPDSSDARRRLPAYLVGGALLGGVVGGLLAASYDFCGDPQPGYSCSQTDTATGVVIGALVGVGVGFLAWAIATRGT